MEKQPKKLGFPSEDDAWSFAERIIKAYPIVVEKPRSVFRLYDYKHPAEFYLERSRPLGHVGSSEGLAASVVLLLDEKRDVKRYERPNRPKQNEFRNATFDRYGSQCAFCRISSDALLDAAHVIAWKDKGSDVAENGLVLCKLHHCALDAGLIRIDPDTLQLRFSNGINPRDLHVEVTGLHHLPALPHIVALRWLWGKTQS